MDIQNQENLVAGYIKNNHVMIDRGATYVFTASTVAEGMRVRQL
jgi:hypothetical protein